MHIKKIDFAYDTYIAVKHQEQDVAFGLVLLSES